MTDLTHIAELLHTTRQREHLGISALAGWLAEHIDDQHGSDQQDGRSRRLESDAAAVQVLTVHRSKGLEFPFVCLPSAWDRYEDSRFVSFPLAHSQDGQRIVHVGGRSDPTFAAALTAHLEEERAEDLRLLYVALTRSSGGMAVWWANSKANTTASALHRALFGTRDLANTVPDRVTIPAPQQIRARFAELASPERTCVEIQAVSASRGSRRVASSGGQRSGGQQAAAGGRPAPAIEHARFTRALDRAWRRTSYTALTAAAHHGTAGTRSADAHDAALTQGTDEPDELGTADEIDTAAAQGGQPRDAGSLPAAAAPSAHLPGGDVPGDQQAWSTPSPMGELAAGPLFGTVVHTVLETLDTTAADLDAELHAHCDRVIDGRFTGSGIDAHHLAQALGPVLRTPLGPLTTWRLADITPTHRLSELSFEYPLAGGDAAPATAGRTLAQIADLLADHLPPEDPLAGYPDALRDPRLPVDPLRGYLTGSIDVVLRLPARALADAGPDPAGAPGQPRYIVVDYKTNWLGQWAGQPLVAAHYRQEAMAASMQAAHYPLQALLYSVALHRFLRWRQPGYDPHVHLGGVAYLYVRGMVGPQAPTQPLTGWPLPARSGVFAWRPPAEAVVALSRLLAQEAPT